MCPCRSVVCRIDAATTSDDIELVAACGRVGNAVIRRVRPSAFTKSRRVQAASESNIGRMLLGGLDQLNPNGSGERKFLPMKHTKLHEKSGDNDQNKPFPSIFLSCPFECFV